MEIFAWKLSSELIIVTVFPLRNHRTIALDKLEKMFILKLFIGIVPLYLGAILTHYRELLALTWIFLPSDYRWSR